METSRSGESPSRLPSRDLPWTLMRSMTPLPAAEHKDGAKIRAATRKIPANLVFMEDAPTRRVSVPRNLNSRQNILPPPTIRPFAQGNSKLAHLEVTPEHSKCVCERA